MTKTLKIGDVRIRLTIRHRFEKNLTTLDKISEFRRWELGVWFRKDRAVGNKVKGIDAFKSNNLVNTYQLGFNFVLGKAWLTFDKNVLIMKID